MSYMQQKAQKFIYYICIFLYKSMLCMHPMQPYINLYVFSYISLCYMHVSYADVYKLVCISLYKSMLCLHPISLFNLVYTVITRKL